MNSEDIVTVSAAVVALTQLSKWGGLPSRLGPIAVLGIALLGVVVWAASTITGWDRALVWPLFAGWITVATSAAGIFGFTRATPEAVSSFTKPATGAGSEPVAVSVGSGVVIETGDDDELDQHDTNDMVSDVRAMRRMLGVDETKHRLRQMRHRAEEELRTGVAPPGE